MWFVRFLVGIAYIFVLGVVAGALGVMSGIDLSDGLGVFVIIGLMVIYWTTRGPLLRALKLLPPVPPAE